MSSDSYWNRGENCVRPFILNAIRVNTKSDLQP